MGNAYVALLRGINVGGRNLIPMAELRALATDLGWSHVRSYIQSGNLLFTDAMTTAVASAALEEAVRERFGLEIPVIVRSAATWSSYVTANPFPAEAAATANRVMLALSKEAPAAGAVAALEERAAAGEQVIQRSDGLWIHFPAGAGRSKLSPAVLDRALGSPVTLRNWRTVLAIDELLHA